MYRINSDINLLDATITSWIDKETKYTCYILKTYNDVLFGFVQTTKDHIIHEMKFDYFYSDNITLTKEEEWFRESNLTQPSHLDNRYQSIGFRYTKSYIDMSRIIERIRILASQIRDYPYIKKYRDIKLYLINEEEKYAGVVARYQYYCIERSQPSNSYDSLPYGNLKFVIFETKPKIDNPPILERLGVLFFCKLNKLQEITIAPLEMIDGLLIPIKESIRTFDIDIDIDYL